MESPVCNFRLLRNDTGSQFSGTISLTGTSTSCTASDSSASGLTISGAGQSVTLALGTPGSVALPTQIDSSNCGGFNQPQLLTPSPLSANVTSLAFFGKDDYRITPLQVNLTTDTLSVLPVPVPAGPLGSGTFGPFPYNFTGCTAPCTSFNPNQFGTETLETLVLNSPLRFSAGSNPNLGGTKFACIPYADFSADGNPMCVELQITPNNSDSYLYTVQNDFDIDGFSLPGGIGGPAFLGKHAVPCPRNPGDFDQNLFLSYSAASVTFGDPLKGGGSGGGSCWVVAFDPRATPFLDPDPNHALLSFNGFAGFSPPGSTPPITTNPVHPGSSVPLNFTFPTAGFKLCPSVNNIGSTCTDLPSLKSWVAFGTLGINCSSGVPNVPLSGEKVAGNSNLQTISSTSTSTSYRFNWKPDKTAPLGTCVVVIAQFSNGLVVYPDDFKFVK